MMRRLRPLPGGRWFGSTRYDPPRRLRLVAREPAYDAHALGLACNHQGPHCPAWRERQDAA